MIHSFHACLRTTENVNIEVYILCMYLCVKRENVNGERCRGLICKLGRNASIPCDSLLLFPAQRFANQE